MINYGNKYNAKPESCGVCMKVVIGRQEPATWPSRSYRKRYVIRIFRPELLRGVELYQCRGCVYVFTTCELRRVDVHSNCDWLAGCWIRLLDDRLSTDGKERSGDR